MHSEAHAALGWLIGNLANNNRRLRNWCVLGAVFPDVDALLIIFGARSYAQWHHTFGHNVFLWAIFSATAGWHCRSHRAVWFVGACFASHLVGDAFFSGWKLYLFFPLSNWGYLPSWHVGLAHPINVWFIYAGFAVALAVVRWRGRSPVDVFSPKLDGVMVAIFGRKTLFCGICGRPGNRCCAECRKPLCLRHGTVRPNLDVVCSECGTRGLMHANGRLPDGRGSKNTTPASEPRA